MRKINISAGYIFIIWMIVVSLLGTVLFVGYSHNTADLRKLMRNEAETIIDIIDIAAQRGIYSLDQVEFLTAKSLLENARFINEIISSAGDIPTSKLGTVSLENALDTVIIINSKGEIVYNNNKTGSLPQILTSLPETEDVLRGLTEEEIFGFDGDMSYTGRQWGAVVAGTGGGAVIVSIDSDRMLDFRKLVGLGTIFREIGYREGIKYITLQDSLGIIAASAGVTEMTGFGEDQFLANISENETRSRMDRENGVMEVVKPLIVDDLNVGIIRVGISTDILDSISKSALHQFMILFFISMVTGVLLFVYFTLRQNYTVLGSEHGRILSEIREMEEQARRTEHLASMGRIAGGIAHEIRNPLNAVSIIAQRLNTEFKPDAEQEEYNTLLGTINKEIARISGIVDHFLKFAKPPELIKEKVDIYEVIKEVENLVSEKAKNLNISINNCCSPGMLCIVDHDSIKQALLNIVLNAIDAAGSDGWIELRSSLKSKEIVITVTDSGTGIPEDILPRIFDPYFTTKDSGNGLGLSEVHRIVTAHDGKIMATQSQNAGAEFVLSLPAGAK